MNKCRKCGLCCRWMCINVARVDFDTHWLDVRGGEVKMDEVSMESFAFVPFVCAHITSDNLCNIHDHKPHWCKRFPVADEPWLRAMGCKYWEEE